MKIETIKRPWEKKYQTRYNPDPFYQSKTWKNIRASFREGYTLTPDGTKLSNKYCIDCYIEHKQRIPGRNTDHIQARKAGGPDDHSNLQTQCDTHHARKSANEGKI